MDHYSQPIAFQVLAITQAIYRALNMSGPPYNTLARIQAKSLRDQTRQLQALERVWAGVFSQDAQMTMALMNMALM